ncbi:hypothetical protein [Desulfosarcina ovata]|uniref:Uncharacterized protein n=2 Tax=Desulfosarcina ovata TaxID=83564 RepID=A0A5K8ADR4_9BACT|nr:hypothetical protein [Desulfosarcina ovata]BBO84254.1 hypothetical protein DSCO28_48200 [Desulfosarcina ovata subsp. sediminis]BBO90762.1 hypothetical protein DSCOOX_39420 [Desulfosarcina ovata subsp. ovata]
MVDIVLVVSGVGLVVFLVLFVLCFITLESIAFFVHLMVRLFRRLISGLRKPHQQQMAPFFRFALTR